MEFTRDFWQIVYWISSISISIAMLVLGIVGYIHVIKQMKADRKARRDRYDIKRREKTVEIIQFYIKDISKETRRAEQLVSNFSKQQCKDLNEMHQFEITSEEKNLLCEICPKYEECKAPAATPSAGLSFECLRSCLDKSTTEKYIIKGQLLVDLRHYVIQYLNTLECCLLALDMGIVDEDIIDSQFHYLQTKDPVLENFRKTIGNGLSYPAIENYYRHIQKKAEEAFEARKSKQTKRPVGDD